MLQPWQGWRTIHLATLRGAQSLYGVQAKEIVLSASDKLTLRVGDVSICLDGKTVKLTVDKGSEVTMNGHNITMLSLSIDLNPVGLPVGESESVPSLLANMPKPPNDKT